MPDFQQTEHFGRRFSPDREIFLAHEAELTETERQSLLCLSESQIERFARSLIVKRRSEVRELIPYSLLFLDETFTSRFETHAQRYHPTGLLKPGDDAYHFLRALSEQTEFSPLARETFRWEAFRLSRCVSPVLPACGMFRVHLMFTPPAHSAVTRGMTFCWFRKGVFTHGGFFKRHGRVRSASNPSLRGGL